MTFSSLGPSLPARLTYPPARSHQAATARVPALAFWTFLTFFVLSLANVGGLVQRVEKQELPISPLMFAAAFLLVMPFTRAQRGFVYLSVAWTFVITYTVLGFLGPYRIVDVSDYSFAQLILKLWISVVGVPWLAIRAVSKDKLPVLVKAATLVATVGAVFAIAQMLVPGPFRFMVTEPGRGSGFWVDANSCGAVCGLFVFVSFLFPFRSKSLNLIVRTLLVVGVLATLSRGGLLGLAVGAIVYGIAAKRLRTVFMISVATVAIMIASSFVLGYVQSERLKGRVERLQEIMRGDFSNTAEARGEVWNLAFMAVQKDWLLGRGHGSMWRVVPIGKGLGPHNYYLFVWGNSGFAALLVFLGLLFTLFRYGMRAEERNSKAALMAMTLMLAAYAMVDHGFIAHQFMGPMLALVAIAGHYAQQDKTLRPNVSPAIPRRTA